jgi:hypothetical protein
MPPKITLDYEIQQVQKILWEDFVEESKSGDRNSKYNDYKLKMAEFLEMKKGELRISKIRGKNRASYNRQAIFI